MKKIAFIGFLGLASAALNVSASEHSHGDGNHGGVHHGPSAHDIDSAPVSTELTVSGCWVRSLPLPAPSAGYFLVKNQGASTVKLVAAASPSYDMVMLHQTTDHDGLSKMSMAESIDIPAKGELEFKPGGYHAMFEKPTSTIEIGSTVNMNFLFDNGQKAVADCEVKPAKTMAH